MFILCFCVTKKAVFKMIETFNKNQLIENFMFCLVSESTHVSKIEIHVDRIEFTY